MTANEGDKLITVLLVLFAGIGFTWVFMWFIETATKWADKAKGGK